MYVRVLGAAAGGGFPQWNCSCSNCRRLRQGTFPGTARSQAQLAISANGENWILANASPDLRYQIESFSPLCPRPASLRQSPIAGVILTSAEVDAALGLLLLRESQPFAVYATGAVRQILADDNTIFRVLHRQTDQVQWRTAAPRHPGQHLQGRARRPKGQVESQVLRYIAGAAHQQPALTAPGVIRFVERHRGQSGTASCRDRESLKVYNTVAGGR
jgi:coenzyme PQQ biosynthesis protein B